MTKIETAILRRSLVMNSEFVATLDLENTIFFT